MNILVTGMLWSGSSAVLDMLKEYENIGILPGEFDEFRRPGMIADHLDGRISSIYPCKINSHIKNKLRPKTLVKIAHKLDAKYFKRLYAIKDFSKKIYDAKSPIEKIALGKDWFNEVRQVYCKDKAFLAIDQPILPGQHFNVWPQVLDPFKMIVVYRDPRDQLAEIIKQHHLFLHMRSPDADIYGGDRLGAIKYQIHTLQVRYDWIDKIRKTHGDDKVVMISFENFIRNNSEIRGKLESWLGLEPDKKVKKVLQPDISIKNIGIYENYLSEEEIELLDELYNQYLIRENENNFY